MNLRDRSTSLLGSALVAALSLSLACNNEGGESTGGTSSSGSSGGGPGTSGDDETTGAATTSGAPTSSTSTGDASDSSTGEPTTGASTTTATTGAGPTDGPGVLPGEDGMDAFCRRYVECGGTYYADQQDCLDATYDYWGDCPSRKAALDEFGACMSEVDCSDWSPDAYNPANTVCAQQWDGVGSSQPC